MASKDLTKAVEDVVLTNLDDLTSYLNTGKSAKYSEPIIGNWEFNPNVTLAWFRRISQDRGQRHARHPGSVVTAYARQNCCSPVTTRFSSRTSPSSSRPPKTSRRSKVKTGKVTGPRRHQLHPACHPQWPGQILDRQHGWTAPPAQDGHTLLIFDHVD